jgi:hypothetical protein
VRGRLDDEKLETLRGWGTGLAADGRDELRAAGKAILILIEEIERLQVEVWHAYDRSQDKVPPPILADRSADAGERSPEADQPALRLDSTLRGRLRRALNNPRPGAG